MLSHESKGETTKTQAPRRSITNNYSLGDAREKPTQIGRAPPAQPPHSAPALQMAGRRRLRLATSPAMYQNPRYACPLSKRPDYVYLCWSTAAAWTQACIDATRRSPHFDDCLTSRGTNTPSSTLTVIKSSLSTHEETVPPLRSLERNACFTGNVSPVESSRCRRPQRSNPPPQHPPRPSCPPHPHPRFKLQDPSRGLQHLVRSAERIELTTESTPAPPLPQTPHAAHPAPRVLPGASPVRSSRAVASSTPRRCGVTSHEEPVPIPSRAEWRWARFLVSWGLDMRRAAPLGARCYVVRSVGVARYRPVSNDSLPPWRTRTARSVCSACCACCLLRSTSLRLESNRGAFKRANRREVLRGDSN
ncbi:hypothetical protein C8R43DRAFT_1163478 [Mycena crocata]|nr:hypothetical protein C8R43DRAFT_1163478 [Mycena crocata]